MKGTWSNVISGTFFEIPFFLFPRNHAGILHEVGFKNIEYFLKVIFLKLNFGKCGPSVRSKRDKCLWKSHAFRRNFKALGFNLIFA